MLMRLGGIFLICLSFGFCAFGQAQGQGDGLGADERPIFSPLGEMRLNFPPVSGEQELPQLPTLQPDFITPPLSSGGFSSLPVQELPASEAILRLDAHLSEQSPPLTRGLVWRVFGAEIGLDNTLPLIDSQQGGHAEFRLDEGVYFVHVAFGRAEFSKRIELHAGRTYYENIELDAGGLILDVAIQDDHVNKNRVRFAIYQHSDDSSEQNLSVEGVKPETVVRLKAGNYHIVSTYGDANAIASADIRVEAGKLTQAVIEHQAAQITLKLVREAGGEALADTSWVIMNASGDTVREIANPHVDIVLIEGDYIAYARHKDQSYAREFSVTAGQDMEIDLRLSRDGVGTEAG